MKKIPVDLEDLQMAFETAFDEVQQFLDKETGKVLFHSEDMPMEMMPEDEDWEADEAFMARYLLIPQDDSWEGYADMEAFIDTVTDPILQDKLAIAIDGSGAFRRFKNVLLGEPERERWFQFKNERVQRRVVEWLALEGFEPA
ncbi:MAG: hypothetical protein F6J87_11145 [Spirulina sp. SIO3F2]|nr:hypothetical protein [Spirulina sp. SIO3F2]